MADRYAEDLNLALSSGNADAVRIASNAIPGNAAPQAAPAGGGAVDPTIARMQAQIDSLTASNANALQKQRTSAYDEMYAVLKQYGIDTDGSGLAATIKGWAQDDKSASWMQVEIRNTDAYKKRFTGMADLVKQGHAISEAQYIQQEIQYTNVMRQWDLPKGFYDDPTDFGRFIANGVSVNELNDRITGAKSFLDSNAPAEYKQALQDMYGVTEGGMLAYVLDGDKAQKVIQTQLKATEVAGASRQNGFNLSTAQAETYGATLGQQYDSFGADARNTLQANMATIGQQADQNARLSAIDNTDYNRTDALDASLMSDSTKQLASTKRAAAEAARFSGSAAAGKSTFTSKNTV